jgi:P4 family phage/plasmid primase-like protien
MAEDPNDILRRSGPDGLRKRLDETPASKVRQLRLTIGSDSEVATCVARDLRASIGQTIHCDGDFYAWGGTHWIKIPVERLHKFIQAYDGCEFQTAAGKPSRYLLNKARHNSVLHLLRLDLTEPDFFRNSPCGVACRSGFIALSDCGEAVLKQHAPEQRQRHLIEADWSGDLTEVPAIGSLLEKLISGSFHRDADAASKPQLLAEMMGVAVFGIATRLTEPKSVILLGETAGNGKSQVLNMMRGLLPASGVASVAPAEMAKEQRRAQLAGVRLNAADELGVEAIRSDTFKAIITGDRISAKTVYKPPFEFFPEAFHVFATNVLPPFADGMDRGVRRRLAILPFGRTIPVEERIPDLGRRIATEEADALLAMATAGAQRVLQQGGFTQIASGRERMAEWIVLSDVVAAFFEDETAVFITGRREDRVTSKDAYRAFCKWTKEEGLPDARRPTHGQFTGRVKELGRPGLRITRTGKSGTCFYGIRLGSGGSSVSV